MDLKLLLEQREKCKATLHDCRVVKVKLDGGILAREIHTFNLERHRTAKRAFVWQQESTIGTREPEFVAVLAIPPINSPEDTLKHIRAQVLKNL